MGFSFPTIFNAGLIDSKKNYKLLLKRRPAFHLAIPITLYSILAPVFPIGCVLKLSSFSCTMMA
jgi:hypothetical protein